VLRGLTATALQPGTITAVLGRNGVGKSTLLRCIAGFADCEADQLHLGGLDLRPLDAATRAASIRYLPQAAPGALHLSVRDSLHVALNARHRHSTYEAGQRIAAVAAELGLTELLERHLDELSGGQKQLVWLGQALIHRPRVLLLDEPLAALDPNYQHHVMQLLRRLAAQLHLVVLVVLHDLNMAIRYADDALVIQEGRIMAQGPVTDALTPDILARAFLVQARVEQCKLGTPLVVIDDLIHL